MASQTNDAITQAFADGHLLRVYRHSPKTKSVLIDVDCATKLNTSPSGSVEMRACVQSPRCHS